MEAFPSPGQNMAPNGLQKSFGGISEPRSEYVSKGSPGAHLESFLRPGQNMAPDGRQEAFLRPGQNMASNGLQEVIWKHFRALVRIWLPLVSRRSFGAFLSPGQNMSPNGFRISFGGISETWSEYGSRWSPGGIWKHF